MAHAYATVNAAAGLAASAFTFTNMTASNKAFLNDAAMDRVCSATASNATRSIDLDFGSATAIVGFALLNHNIASWSPTSITIKAADAADFVSGLVTAKAASGVNTDAPNEKDLILQFPAYTKRYWRIEFASSATETLRLGELFALGSSALTALTRTKAYGHGESEAYVTNRTESRTGNVRSTFLAGPLRTKRLPFVDLQGVSQREELMAMWRAAKGDVTNLLWVEYVESTNTAATDAGMECLYGKLQPALSWRETDYTLFDVDALELRQVGRDVGR